MDGYLPHHVEHGFVEEVIQEPDAGLTGVFFEGDGIAIDDFDGLIVD